jgi:hypothetical protein
VSAGRAVKVAIKNAIGFRGVKTVKIVGGPARGVTMTLDFSGHTPMYLGMYEWELHRFLRETLPSVRRVFDVGGYLGYDTLIFAANTNADGEVVTFEPDPESRVKLEGNLDHNPELRGKVTLEPLAIGTDQADGATTIDAMSERHGPPDLIKIDIDGGELDALRGGAGTFRERRPHLIVETHSKLLEDDCGSLLVAYGYRPIIKHNRQVWREQRGGAEHNRWLLARGEPGPWAVRA